MNRSRVVVIAPAVLVVAGWYGALYRPGQVAISADREATAVARQQLVAAKTTAGSKADPATLEAQLATLRRAVPPDADLGGFFSALNEAATQAGVKLIDTTPAAPEPSAVGGAAPGGATAGTVRSVGIHQVARGERARLVDYLGKLSKLDRVVVVDDVTLTSEDANTSSLTLEMRIFTAT